jgi:hypothetical protein
MHVPQEGTEHNVPEHGHKKTAMCHRKAQNVARHKKPFLNFKITKG